MLDEEFGRDALVGGDVPAHVGLVMPLEAQGYEDLGDGRTTQLPADFSPARAAEYGADACKLLLPFRPDLETAAESQERLVERTANACHVVGLPLVVEPIVYQRPCESDEQYATLFTDLVVTSANRLAQLDVDMFKLPFPIADTIAEPDQRSAAEACARLNAACLGRAWVLLGGGGGDAEVLQRQLRIAAAAGASGFLVGRAIWGPALRQGLEITAEQARQVALPAFLACRTIAREAA
jgi:tagatose-1,6-bisphosphate aldolase